MKKTLNITVFLSWFNGVVASILVAFGLIAVVLTHGNIGMLLSILLVSAVILHSYAAIQLHKTLVNPEILLDRQTPVGIRFIGFAALFFAMLNGNYSIDLLQHTQEYVKQIKMPAGSQKIPVSPILQFIASISLLFSASVAVNVILNIRLLRKWYRDQLHGK